MRQTVYFATNRNPETDPSGMIIGFGSDLGPVSGLSVRYGSAEVDVDLKATTANFVEGSLRVAPEQLSGPAGFKPILGSQTIFDAVRDAMKTGGRPTLGLIHGFSNSFESSICRAGWVKEFYAENNGIDANMFAFSWPSQQSLAFLPLPYIDYEHDRSTAASSGVPIARTLRTLQAYIDGLPADERCNRSLHLICHSMGNYVFRHTVQALLRMPDPTLSIGKGSQLPLIDRGDPDPVVLRRMFEHIVLAAADEDDDAFDDVHKLKYLPRLASTVTVYHSNKDWVLNTLSRWTKFNGPRLGTDGPDNMSTISDKVTAVDVSQLLNLNEDPENHQYYRVFPKIRDDIVSVLKGVPTDKIPHREPLLEGRYRLLP